MRKCFFIMLICLTVSLQAQTHLSPPDGGDGVAGRIPGSFAVEWEAVEGAVAYGYVLTDNSDCFVGCAGDTRQGKLTNNRVIQFGLQEGVFYYWITQVYFANGDSSGWSPISSFRAITKEVDQVISMSSPAGEKGILWVDWQGITDVLEIKLRMIDINGRQLRPEPFSPIWQGLRPRNGFERFTRYEIPLTGVQPGVYILIFALQRANSEEIQMKKFVVR